jgi:hypothetical protein
MRWGDSKNGDVLWWLLAGVLGEGFFLLGFGLPLGNALIVGHVGLFIAGAVMGYVKPERVWRWGIGSVLFFPVVEFIGISTDHSLSYSLFDSLAYVVVKVPLYGLQALPAMMGAYLAASGKQGVPKVADLKLFAKKVWPLVVGFTIGLTIGVIYIVLEDAISLRQVVGGFFLVAVVLGVMQPHLGWRWGISIGLGHVTVITLRIIADGLLGRSSHNLFPIEVLLAVLVAGPPAVAGSYTGVALRWVFGASSGNGKLTEREK